MKLADADVISFPRKLVEHRLLGLENQLNRHLVKLIAFDFSPQLRQRFRQELDNWLYEIQALRLKPNNRTGSFKFYYDLLFDFPFWGVEVENMRKMMEFIAREYGNVQPTKSPKWLHGCNNSIPSSPSVCTTAKTCST